MLLHENFHPEGTRLVLISDDRSARLWDTASGKPVGEAMAHKAAVRSAMFSPDGKRVVTASDDTSVRLWDGESGKPLARPIVHPKPVSFASVSRDGERILSACADANARLWGADGTALADPLAHEGPITAALFGPVGKLALTASEDGTAVIRQARNGAPLANGLLQHPGPVRSAGFTARDEVVWTTCGDGRVRLFAAATGKLATDRIGHDGGRLGADVSAARVVTFNGEDAAARLWASDAQPVGPLEHGGAVLAARFSADGARVATGAADGTVRIWLAETGKPAGDPMRIKGRVAELLFSPDGKLLLVLSADRVARLFESEGGKLVGQPMLLGEKAPADVQTSTQVLEPSTITRLGGDRVVTLNGITGLFTPISSADDGRPLGEDERKNLLAIIDQLKREVAEVQSQNLKLRADLAALRERPAAPDDFASGVQQSLDELQQRMATMRNSTSNFAVREFKLDASVFVQVSPLGSIEYRFVQPGDKVEPAALSKLSLNLVPVPKGNLAGVWTPDLFEPERPIGALPGVTERQAEQLQAAGMFSIGEFLQVGTRARSQAYLTALLDVDRMRLAAWAQQAALMALRGVDGRVAQVLIRAGFGSFDALAVSAPEVIQPAYDAARAQLPDLNAPEFDAALAALWVRAARQYLGLPEAATED